MDRQSSPLVCCGCAPVHLHQGAPGFRRDATETLPRNVQLDRPAHLRRARKGTARSTKASRPHADKIGSRKHLIGMKWARARRPARATARCACCGTQSLTHRCNTLLSSRMPVDACTSAWFRAAQRACWGCRSASSTSTRTGHSSTSRS